MAPRPKGLNEKTARIDVPVPQHVSDKLDEVAERRGLRRTECARRILYRGLKIPADARIIEDEGAP